MAPITRTVREALEAADVLLVPLQTDIRLDAASQALVGELITANTLALNALRPDNTIVAGQREARASQIDDKVLANLTIERAHEAEIGIAAYYNALDLSQDAATSIRAGVGTFISDISVV